MNVIVGWIVGNTQSGPHSFRKKKPLGWQYSDGLVTQSYHEAEIARLRAELQNAAKAALDAVALSCEKEREADALRAEVEGLREVLKKAWEDVNWMTNEGALLSRECFGYLDAAMGASA
ncbi:hypothetical protein JAK47_01880 [Stenotrophomonas maltophilia]|uniref:hypothetical protein n=1 Tax=Stenotrophomonas maltophilia TaxID=40324 RepID=UPI0021C77C51|nr:hypothetical protein [Stenotrophomonas maltophilia]MCU1053295.1 hypothetical protein [Stenotrophomonas maltophilia]